MSKLQHFCRDMMESLFIFKVKSTICIQIKQNSANQERQRGNEKRNTLKVYHKNVYHLAHTHSDNNKILFGKTRAGEKRRKMPAAIPTSFSHTHAQALPVTYYTPPHHA